MLRKSSIDSFPAKTKLYPPLFTTSANSFATASPSVASVFTLIASSAPIAKAFLNVASASAPPTFTTVTPATDFGNAPGGFQTLSYLKDGNVLNSFKSLKHKAKLL